MKPSNYLGKYYSWTKTPATSPSYNYTSSANQTKNSRKRRPSSPEKPHDWPYCGLENDGNISGVFSLKSACPLNDDDAATEEETSSTLETSNFEECESVDTLPSIPNIDNSIPQEQQIPETLFSPPKKSGHRATLTIVSPTEQPKAKANTTALRFHPESTNNDHDKKSKRPRRVYGFHQNPHQRWQHYCDSGAHELLSILKLQQKQDEKQKSAVAPSSPINMIPSEISLSATKMNPTVKNGPQIDTISVTYSNANTSIKNKEESRKNTEEEDNTVELNHLMPSLLVPSSLSNKTTSPTPPIYGEDANDSDDSDTVVYFHCMEGSSRVPFSHTIHNHASVPASSPPSFHHPSYYPMPRYSPLKYDKPDVTPRKQNHQPPLKLLKLPNKNHKHHLPVQQGRDYSYQVTNTPVNSPDAVDTNNSSSSSTSPSKTSSSSFFSRFWTFHSYQNIVSDRNPNKSK